MKIALIGFGVQGKKRFKMAGQNIAFIVDPISAFANFKKIQDVPVSQFDAAYVCTPDKEKLPIIDYLIKNNKHILCEKPLYLDKPYRFAELQRKVNRKKLILYTAYNHRFEPSIIQMKEIIDSKKLGKIYSVKLCYGNGTARDVLNSDWRDTGSGVSLDLGSHLFDLLDYFFEDKKFEFKSVALDRFENRAPDHVILVSKDSIPRIQIEVSFCMWKNTFTCDIVGSKGSLHLNGLTKWGKSSLVFRSRVLPSGKPLEKKLNYTKGDSTWVAEHKHFNNLIKSLNKTNLSKDQTIFVQLSKLTSKS